MSMLLFALTLVATLLHPVAAHAPNAPVHASPTSANATPPAPAAPAAADPNPPEPTLVTEATRADPDALAALETPGEVFFREDFEERDALKKFFDADARKDGIILLTRSATLAHSGIGALRCTAVDKGGKSSSAGLNYWFGTPRRKGNAQADPGYERVHFRYYIKWAEGYDPGLFHHTGGTLAAVAGSNTWEGLTTVGKRPTGKDYCTTRFQASVERRRHPPPGAMFSNTTWMDMKPERDGAFWGTMLGPDEDARFLPEPGTWYCMEQMIQLNSFKDGQPQADGQLATWINGTLYTHYTNIRWRASPSVRIKRCGVGIYVYASKQENTVWYDDLALSTGYIGPLPDPKTPAKSPAPQSAPPPNPAPPNPAPPNPAP